MADLVAYQEVQPDGTKVNHVFTFDTWGNTVHWTQIDDAGNWGAEVLNRSPDAQADPRKFRAPSTALGDVVCVQEVPAGTVPNPQP